MNDIGILTELTWLGRIVLSASLTAVIGWDRERRRRPAGLRTHALVGVSSTLLAGLGELFITRYSSTDGVQLDPLRVTEALVTGISFLGAGTIFVSKGDVKGLTTAASLLAAGGVGMAVGLGVYILAVGTTLLLWLILGLLYRVNVPEKSA